MLKNFALIWTLTAVLWPLQSVADVVTALDEAEDYLTVNPAHTIVLLDSIKDQTKEPLDLFIRHNVLLLRASVPTNKLDRLIQALDVIFEYHQHPYFQQELTAITSALGIWLRRNNYLHDAQSSIACSYKYATTDKQRLTLTNSKALLAWQLDEPDKARTLFNQAQALARQSAQLNVLAMAENNLGLLAFDQGNIQVAETHFRTALTQYQALSLRAGQISAGINLLFIFLIQEDITNFQRLYAPTAILTRSFPNQAKQALLFWLETRFQQLQGQTIVEKTRQQLRETFGQMEDRKVKLLIQRYLAPKLELELTLPEPADRKIFERSWFSKVIECAWPLNSGAKGSK
ncbi:tetratricopeptide repeat protein [Arsukibacterium indicum]|uniref:Tetratricopeptide repeat protein n=1 Tax=Arsukibacterium indicum TaxID=2848612 RepID=A0ABS6MMW2_9GAMM|nr:tetratricopeptide repeat protein [Arsukibacterium indicum]MBV2130149.1 tetratricopeptide repeat protein [Arsukibacterium indicum]